MSTIPVSEVVRVTPSVLPAGGSALALSGLILTTNTRTPIGAVVPFVDADSVGVYFGQTSTEKRNADVYFAGFKGSNKKPGKVLFAQYPLANVRAYLRGGNVSDLTLAQLQAFSGTLSVTIDGVLKTGSVNLSGATSFTNAAEIISNTLSILGGHSSSFTGSIATTTLTVSAISDGALGPGEVVAGVGVTAGTYILAQLTGPTGGIGTYSVSASQTVGSESMTSTEPAVTYDSISGAFAIISPTTGAASAITFGSGIMATDLKLTSVTGAVLSQGANAAAPAAFMASLVLNTRAFGTWMLNFNPDASGNDARFAFAQWNGTQNGRFGFVTVDDDASPTVTVPATSCLAQRIVTAQISGSNCNWQPSGLSALEYGSLAAFVCGTAASIDFTQVNGRITFKFRQQSGLVPGVTDETTFNNLALNGYNSYGAYGDGDVDFTWYADGVVSGEFLWMDSFVNQIWLNGAFRSALVNLLQSAFSIPYNPAGKATVEAALADTINQGLSFGAYRSGVILSSSQIADVNARAGKNISDTLSNQGWYLLVGDATPEVRQARGSPPLTFFYVDGESVQDFDMASIALQ